MPDHTQTNRCACGARVTHRLVRLDWGGTFWVSDNHDTPTGKPCIVHRDLKPDNMRRKPN